MNRFILAALTLTIAVCNSFAQTELTDTGRYKLAADYSRENRGVSVLVMKGDKIVFEEYQNGNTADRTNFLASGTKSFSGVMAAAAIDDKLIKNLDERVADTITEWKSDPRKSKITIRQLLSLTSGIDAGQIGRVPGYADSIKSAANYEPGTHFEYGPVPFQIFGELMTRKLKSKNESVMAYLKRRILDPIGLDIGFWRTDNGQPLLPQGASLTAREWVKFGQLLEQNGKWKGKQIISQKSLDELVIGSKANPAYGITFWLNQKGRGPRGRAGRGDTEGVMANGIADGVSDLFMAAGAGKQRLYIIRSLDMVVVRQGNFGTWDDAEFIRRILTGVAK